MTSTLPKTTHLMETQEKLQNFELKNEETKTEKVIEMEMLLGEVFDAVSAMKKTYVSLQEAHCPWDQDKMPVAVISELKRLGVLRERYRRNSRNGRGEWRERYRPNSLREVVAPYESAVDELRQQVKAKENEINDLKETTLLVVERKISRNEKLLAEVKHQLICCLHLTCLKTSTVRECSTQYRDVKAMDPMELFGILPTCSFGNFCFKKYLAIVHPKMEEVLFGDLEQRRQVLAGSHPRSQFYGEFLGLAKAVWLLHLLAFFIGSSIKSF
ncbi:hypothetical protein K7X08_019887 [Anisodus acutangulus]|uniref:DUF641 domain-containing protein n=1 Tax=Anisodus acutangulus TaxID=402998 RepID=A0A9Q1MTE0_9SOLA|nr:hypothetical protein K7X08_019887 [Anisodus acutangulus]